MHPDNNNYTTRYSYVVPMMETQTRGKGTIDHGLQGSVGTLDDANPTKLSKRSQAVPLQIISLVVLND